MTQDEKQMAAIEKGLVLMGVPRPIVRERLRFVDAFPEFRHLRDRARTCFQADEPYGVAFVGKTRAARAFGTFGKMLALNGVTLRFVGWKELAEAVKSDTVTALMDGYRVMMLTGLPMQDDEMAGHRDAAADAIDRLAADGVWFVLHAKAPLDALSIGDGVRDALGQAIVDVVTVEG